MKKVWVLEGFISRKEMEKSLEEVISIKSKATTSEQEDACNEMESIYRNELNKYPEGHWLGYQGKINYKQFCYSAKETLRNMRKQKMQWRVVEALINDSAETWVSYEIIKENPGVMKYLWATA